MRFKCLTATIAILVGALFWHLRAEQTPEAKKDANPDAAELIKHGDYLVNEVAHCSHCHTPPDSKGEPDRDRLLQGATLGIMPKKKTENWADKAPDITASGLAGRLSEEELVKFLTTGLNPVEEKPIPPMPIFHLNTRDARAVVLYLKSLPGSKGKRDSDKRSKDAR